jgi:uncharacterized protein (TIGR02246 family)
MSSASISCIRANFSADAANLRGQVKAEKTMRKFFLVCAMLITMTVAAVAGPKEEAFQVVDKFKAAFDASDVQGVVKLFAPDAIFLGTVSPKIITTTVGIEQYFQSLKQFTPRQFKIEQYSTMVLSDRAVLFVGFDTFSQTRNGKVVENPARFTLLITKSVQGWRISHFHSSVRPKPQ